MILWSRYTLIALAVSFFISIVVINVYFVYTIVEERDNLTDEVEEAVTAKSVKEPEPKVKSIHSLKHKTRYYVATGPSQLTATIKATKKIKDVAKELESIYRGHSKEYQIILQKVHSDLRQTVNNSLKLWKVAEEWVTGMQVLPVKAPLLGSVLNTLCSAKIIKADNTRRGTQLKVLLTLEGGQQALFKPQWYPRNEIIKGPVYAGRDRHNAEVAAFHLSLLLDVRRVPLTVGRKVDLRREVMPVATKELLNTFYEDGNKTCFYGVCMYCEPQSPVCGTNGIMEGALIMWLPTYIRFERHPNPWQRSYKDTLVARWQVEENYCTKVKNTREYDPDSNTRLLDLIETVVFDFLIDNGDRHHYELPIGLTPSSIFLFDNGKSFGNPYDDHIDILAPLYQCCIIRKKTWERLKVFAGGSLSSSLEKIMKYSHISPVLTRAHLNALDRRLLYIFAAVEVCIREHGVSNVLL